MALQIKLAVTKVITFITTDAIQWMKNITHELSNLNVHTATI